MEPQYYFGEVVLDVLLAEGIVCGLTENAACFSLIVTFQEWDLETEQAHSVAHQNFLLQKC